jgi:DNA polymerase III epsilon subunit family exonuclease
MTRNILDQQLIQHNIVVFDIETTGLNPETDEIIQIALVQLQNGIMADTQQEWKINPGENRLISPKITRLTGLSAKALHGAPSLSEVYPQFGKAIGSSIVAGHNIRRFDLRFLRAVEARYKLPAVPKSYYLDTYLLAKRLRPAQKNHKLATCAQEYGISFDPDTLHNALADTLLCANLLTHQIQELQNIGIGTFRELAHFLKRTVPVQRHTYARL